MMTEPIGRPRLVDRDIAEAVSGADRLAAAGRDSFSVTGDASVTRSHPEAEDWQKIIGGRQQWSSADVVVSNGQVTMTIAVNQPPGSESSR